MTTLTDAIHRRHNPLASNPFRVAAAASVLVHLVLIWGGLPQWRLPSFELPVWRDADDRLTVRLVPAPAEPPAPAPPPAPRARVRPAPPVIAPDRPAPAPPPPAASTAPAAAPAPTPARPPAGGDLSAYIESRRRARVEAAPSQGSVPEPPAAAENDNARASRLAAANLATQRQITFGYDPERSGGVFQITRLAHDHAEFDFIGWNRNARRRTKQSIEVRIGSHGDIRLAVVRRMIAIIREHEPVEFLWDSQRLGRSLMLSSLPRDSAGLEGFMMQEFFTAAR